MKIETGENLDTNISDAVAFKASANASKLFAMLGNYLYSKKEECVLHEISANGVDAHRMVGKEDQPISVVLPTRLDCQVRIRDYGPGLSEADVYRFLTSYGESNKQGSNDFIGGWGIGSKSPAAVSDTWKIVSMHDGILNEFLVFVNGDGIPSLTKIRTCDTDETGIEVAIPVSADKIQTWVSAASSVYAFYTLPPKLKNYPYGQITSKVPAEKNGKNWWWKKGSYSGGITVIASNRSYLCETSKLQQEFSGSSVAGLLGLPLYLEMAIGEVDLSISREQLQYTKKTYDAIRAVLEEVLLNLKTSFDTDMGLATDELDYRVRLISHMEKNYGVRSMSHLPFIAKMVSGKYGILDDRGLTKLVFGADGVTAEELEKLDVRVYNGTAMRRANPGFNCWRTFAFGTNSVWDNAKRYYTYKFELRLDWFERMVFVLNDCADGYARVKAAHVSGKYYAIFKDDSDLPDVIKSRLVKASTYNKVPRQSSRTAVQKTDDDVYVINRNGNGFSRIKRSDLPDDVAYVLTDNFVSSYVLQTDKFVNYLSELGYTIVATKDSNEVVGRSPEDELKKYYETRKNSPSVKSELNILKLDAVREFGIASLMSSGIRTTISSDWNKFADDNATLIKTACFTRSGYGQTLFNIRAVEAIATLLGVKFETPEVDSIKKELQTLAEKYKVVNYMRIDLASDQQAAKVFTQILDLSV